LLKSRSRGGAFCGLAQQPVAAHSLDWAWSAYPRRQQQPKCPSKQSIISKRPKVRRNAGPAPSSGRLHPAAMLKGRLALRAGVLSIRRKADPVRCALNSANVRFPPIPAAIALVIAFDPKRTLQAAANGPPPRRGGGGPTCPAGAYGADGFSDDPRDCAGPSPGPGWKPTRWPFHFRWRPAKTHW